MSTVLIFFVLTPVLIGAFMLFDQLVRLEYRLHRKNWEADGQPHGFFWVPPESKSFGGLLVKLHSGFSKQRCSLRWLFSTPDWVRDDKRAASLLFGYRLLTLVWNVAILGIAITTLMFRS